MFVLSTRFHSIEASEPFHSHTSQAISGRVGHWLSMAITPADFFGAFGMGPWIFQT